MTISLIIPTLNEAAIIGQLVHYLRKNADNRLLEIIVSDAQSSDDTEGVALKAGAKVIQSAVKGRAVQMNKGAKVAQGNILYFVHADCIPPKTYINDIFECINTGFPIGCYRYRFDSDRLLLKINGYFNRFDPLWCRGGDETLFITKEIFDNIGGFDEKYVIMEEYDLIKRARDIHPFKIIPKYAVVSARKYDTNSWLRVQWANYQAFKMFKRGDEPKKIALFYKTALDYR
jgi:rSAM/selenodomain-associated transferase 2